ncbi:MAG: hypothetical protein OEU92_13710 [Alphaproteobacteria bacterium]|nr:hypothetical protein [Alphaproteobacteria bacterium]
MPRPLPILSSLVCVFSLTAATAFAAGITPVAPDIETPAQPVSLSTDGPLIELVTPKNGGIYTSPIGIDIMFAPRNGADIDLSTLKVTVVSTTVVGVFELDITEDIIDHASEHGIKAPNADIPAGEHVVTIQIADTEERLAERQLSITVREESVLERRAEN